MTVIAVLLAPLLVGAAAQFSSTYSPTPRPPLSRDTTECLDTLHAGDSLSGIVTMTVRPQDRKTVLPSDFEGLFVQEFRSRLKVPRNLPLSVMVGWRPCEPASGRCASGVLMLGSHAYVTAHPEGGLSRIAVVDMSLTPAFADSVRVVLERIGAENMSPFFSRADSIPLEIAIRVELPSDSAPPGRHLLLIKIPHYKVPFTPAGGAKDPKKPKYPSIAERNRIGDSVAVTFTILPDGTVAPQSIDVHAGYYRNFTRSVLDNLVTTSYTPAHIGACPVASRVFQAFAFKVP